MVHIKNIEIIKRRNKSNKTMNKRCKCIQERQPSACTLMAADAIYKEQRLYVLDVKVR